jgi:hypothetical protein
MAKNIFNFHLIMQHNKAAKKRITILFLSLKFSTQFVTALFAQP